MLHEVKPLDLTVRINDLWDNKWFLLTAGSFTHDEYNTMTIAWGSFGIMWNKPFVQVVVRPTRFTYQFMEKYKTFTLCRFPEKYKTELKLLGSKSGRDINKIKESGLTVKQSTTVEAPCFEEADMIFECNKIYYDDFKPENFLDSGIEKNYPLKDYHRIYFGEILKILEL
ncbi:MAG: flavin reductase [Ignavibacteriae bacterium HGW-Ignavibacteriae-2]|jgi:flavin reductase (DIM6/NTAB) family NADH-FMN oxidoreductase RutF|nr:MAG: flavin reductase [Ignavibacteriae bacterium HGW-Ignavibacteriae-2]